MITARRAEPYRDQRGAVDGRDADGDRSDSSNAFVAQTNVAGRTATAKLSINTAGVWTYDGHTAHNEFVAGQDYKRLITVATADGTQQVLTVTMHAPTMRR